MVAVQEKEHAQTVMMNQSTEIAGNVGAVGWRKLVKLERFYR